MDSRVPPYNAEAESCVLSSILTDNSTMAVAMRYLEEEHFYQESHRKIYAAMIAVANSGAVVEPVTVGGHLRERGELEKVGGAVVFSQLLDTHAVSSSIDHYAKMVRSLAVRRKIIYASQEISAAGYSNVESVEDYIESANKSIMEASSGLGIGGGPQRVDDTVRKIIKDLESKEEIEGVVKTGLPNLDRRTGGLWPGLLTVIAGRPSMGKSAFAVNIAANATLAGKRVLYVTLEDTRYYVVLRMMSRFADVDLTDLTLRKIKHEDWPRVIEAANLISGKKPLWIEDTSGLTTQAIRQIVVAHQMLHGLDLVIVDHLGEVADKGESDTSIISKAASGFRDIAKDLNIPVALLAQLNRKVEERGDKRPMLSDLKQSGKIEEVARLVWFLYRPGYYKADGADSREAQVIVAKANHGKTGILNLWMNLSRMYVRDWDPGTDGLFSSDGSGSAAAQNNTRDRRYYGNRQNDLFGNGAGNDY